MKIIYDRYPRQWGRFLALTGFVVLPLKKFLFNLGFNIFFGNKSQDCWVVQEVFNYKKNGFFLDLAATDGIHENNTYFLEKKLGWRGICIEPNSIFFKKLKINRNVICLNYVISKKKKIFFFENGGIGGIIGKEYDNNFQKRKSIILEKKNLIKKKNPKSLTYILNKYKAPKVIEYMSLDVEGAEYDVMSSLNFKKFKILSMTIERPSQKLNKLLKKNGYIFVKNYKVDGFYVHKSMKNIKSLNYEKFYQIGSKKW